MKVTLLTAFLFGVVPFLHGGALDHWRGEILSEYEQGSTSPAWREADDLPRDYSVTQAVHLLYAKYAGDAGWQAGGARLAVPIDAAKLKFATRSWSPGKSNRTFAAWLSKGHSDPVYLTEEGLTPNPQADACAVTNFLKQVVMGGSFRGEISWYPQICRASEIAVLSGFLGKTVKSPYEDYYFFFLDDHPYANWGHDCRYVLIAADLSSYVILYQNEPPRLTKDGERVELEKIAAVTRAPTLTQTAGIRGVRTLLKSANTLTLGNGINPSAKINYSGSTAHTYAILISGGVNRSQNFSRYWGDMAMVYSTLTRYYSVPKNHITVCMSDGSNTTADMHYVQAPSFAIAESITPTVNQYKDSPVDLDGDGISDVTSDATKSSISAAFSSLANKLTSADHLLVFITDHGSYDKSNGESYVCTWAGYTGSATSGTMLSVSELHEMTKDIPAFTVFAFEFCYSGNFVKKLVTSPNRVVATACGNEESSEFLWRGSDGTVLTACMGEEDHENQYAYCNPWAWLFASAFRGVAPDFSFSPWNGFIDNGISMDASEADADADGRLNFQEVAQYASGMVTTSLVYTINGVRYTFEDTPQYGESRTGLGKAFYIAGDVEAAPATPQAPTIRATFVDTSILKMNFVLASWTKVSGAKTYNLYKSTTKTRPDTPLVSGLTDCSHQDNAVTKGMTYYYWVEAVNSIGLSTIGPVGYEGAEQPTTTKTLKSLRVSGLESVTSGAQTAYTCTAIYSDGSSTSVVPTWTIQSGASYASINASGILTAQSVTSTQVVTIRATYKDGTEVSVDYSVTITPASVVVKETQNVYFTNAAGEQSVTLTYDAPSGSFKLSDNVSGMPGWLTLKRSTSTSMSAGVLHWQNKLTITTLENTETSAREWTYQCTVCDKCFCVVIRQTGKPVVKTYSIAFYKSPAAMGSAAEYDLTLMPTISVEYGKVVALPKNKFTSSWTNLKFSHWQCSNGRYYDDGILVYNLANPGETVTMTAVWK